MSSAPSAGSASPADPARAPDAPEGATGAPADATTGAKGLSIAKVGAIGGAMIGVACVAPAYTLTSGLGPSISEVGLQMPAVLLVCLVPMLLVMTAYRELNAAMPDAGTSFTWTGRAFGPWLGWMAGWGLIAATTLVLSNLAAVAVDFLFILAAQVFGRPEIAELSSVLWLNIAVTALFTTVAAWVSYRGVELTQRVQLGLTVLQVVALLWYVIAAFAEIAGGRAYDYQPVELSWFDPTAVGDGAVLAAGISLSVFLFWGWDTVVTMNEEARDPRRTPARAAVLTLVVIALLYVLTTVATLSYAGIGESGLGAGNPDNQESLFAVLAEPILGPFSLLMSIAILLSALSSLQATMVSPSRTLLAMSHYGAMPDALRRVHPRYESPSVATLVTAVATVAFYVLMRLVSENALWDTITALGMMVCFYYGLTGLAAVWYFRRTWFTSARTVAFRLVCPLLGGLALLGLFLRTAIDAIEPSYGSGSALFATRWDEQGVAVDGIGLVFVTGIGVLLLGVVLMVVCAIRRPAYFRGTTMPMTAAERGE